MREVKYTALEVWDLLLRPDNSFSDIFIKKVFCNKFDWFGDFKFYTFKLWDRYIKKEEGDEFYLIAKESRIDKTLYVDYLTSSSKNLAYKAFRWVLDNLDNLSEYEANISAFIGSVYIIDCSGYDAFKLNEQNSGEAKINDMVFMLSSDDHCEANFMFNLVSVGNNFKEVKSFFELPDLSYLRNAISELFDACPLLKLQYQSCDRLQVVKTLDVLTCLFILCIPATYSIGVGSEQYETYKSVIKSLLEEII